MWYVVATGVTLSGTDAWAFQLDGLITLTEDGDFGGNAVVVEKATDFEMFSSNGLGAIQGQGYLTRKDGGSQNARLLRVSFLLCFVATLYHMLFPSPIP